jgi:hypothetical protein
MLLELTVPCVYVNFNNCVWYIDRAAIVKACDEIAAELKKTMQQIVSAKLTVNPC